MRSAKTYLLLILFCSAPFLGYSQIDLTLNKKATKYAEAYNLLIESNEPAFVQGTDRLRAEKHEAFQNSEWVGRDSVEYSYDANGQKIVDLFLFWNNTEWQPASKRLYEYNDNGDLSTLVLQIYNGLDFENSNQAVYEYDENNLLLNEAINLWQNDDWLPAVINEFEYDEDGNKTAEITKNFNGGGFVNNRVLWFEYDDNNNNTLWLNQTWDGIQWVNFRQSFMQYDEDNSLIVNFNQNWMNDQWVNDWNYTFVYDENKQNTQIISQMWSEANVEFENIWLNRYVFNENGYLTFAYQDDWEDGVWFPDVKNIYEYDDADNLIFSSNQRWRNERWQLFNRSFFHYDLNTSADFVEVQNTMNVFPNPSNGVFRIDLNQTVNDGSISVMNSQGQQLIEMKVSNAQQSALINLAAYPSGIYIVQFRTTDSIESQLVEKL